MVDARPTAEGAPPALYAALFAPGTKWSVTHVRTSSSTKMADVPQGQRAKTVLTCEVRAVVQRPWGLVSRVECPGLGDELVGPDPLGGHWVATRVGLFYFATDPGAAQPAFTESALVLAADPKPGHHEHVDPDSRFGPVWSKDVVQTKGTWCAEQTFASGDRTQRGTCFEAGRGLVRAHSAATVGLTAYIDTFTLVLAKRAQPLGSP